MRRHSTPKRSLLSLALVGLVAGCGADATGPIKEQENLFTASEAIMVASAILDEISNAMGDASGFGGLFNAVPTAAAFSSVPVTKTQSVNSKCAAGGNIGGSYTYTENIVTIGNSTFVGSFTALPKGCKVSTGTRLIAVDGNLTYTFDWTMSQDFKAYHFKWRGVGDFSWEGGRCKMDYTMDMSEAAGKSSISGSICGVNLNGSYLRRPTR